MIDLKNIFIIAKFTFLELYKSKILINIIFLGLGILLVSYLASQLTHGVPTRIALDFGLGTLSLSTVGISIFMGANLIQKELETRTVYMIISKPIKRFYFILGKIMGISTILLINTLILGGISISFFVFLGGENSFLLFWTIVFIYLGSKIIFFVAPFFSMLTNTTMTVLYSIIIFILGHAIGSSFSLPLIQKNPILFKLLQFYSYFFPDLSKLNIKDFVIYQQSLPGEFIQGVLIYGFTYCIMLILLLFLIFERKDLD
ncbi:MAG: ABC transporter permease subunit [Halobacteriovoraceae bacterium]|nr:ABC transporter permease subunit [Halobacteriovoraceae bacterium]